MYGRESAGHRLTSAMYQPADTTIVAAPTRSLPIRFQIPTGAATRNASPRPGTIRNACNIFVRNAKPMTQPANAIQRVLAVSVARTMQYAAATSRRTSNASGLLNRNISAATGVRASTAPAIRPAAGPLVRRTVAYSSATAATPISASGSSIVNALNPNSLPNKPITHNAAGGLSTVIALPASSEPNSHAFQSWVPACAAAA